MRRNLYYYVTPKVGKYYFGKATTDFLTAQIQLASAKKMMPNDGWHIVQICA